MVCLFCDSKKSKINFFKENTLEKCKKIAYIRKQHNLADGNIIFPFRVSDFEGYHSDCYRRFTALSPKARKTFQLATKES